MSMWLALLATAMAELPKPIKMENWITDADYPPAAVREKLEGSTRFRLVVSPSGQPESCAVVLESGVPALDTKVCMLLMKRARFKPAKDNDGTPIYGTMTTVVNWRVPQGNGPIRSQSVDLILVVAKLPKATKMPSKVSLELLVDEAGQIESCATSPDSPNGKLLGAAACAQVNALLKLKPMQDPQGRTVRSMQDISVGFNEEAKTSD